MARAFLRSFEAHSRSYVTKMIDKNAPSGRVRSSRHSAAQTPSPLFYRRTTGTLPVVLFLLPLVLLWLSTPVGVTHSTQRHLNVERQAEYNAESFLLCPTSC